VADHPDAISATHLKMGLILKILGGYGRFEVTCRGPVGFTSVI